MKKITALFLTGIVIISCGEKSKTENAKQSLLPPPRFQAKGLWKSYDSFISAGECR